MSNPKITAALSVYNVAEYLPKCLDCVVNQTFRDIEILCIDDLSTDDTYKILERYAAKDSRIRVIRQPKNAGLSVSRNKAIAEAKGEYIWMLDGDDLFELDLLEKAYSAVKKVDADVAIWDYYVFENECDIENKSFIKTRLDGISTTDYFQLLSLPSFMWIRLYKMSFLKKLNVRFSPMLTKQDIPINWQTLSNKPKVAIVPKVMSYYRMRATSTTNRKGKSLFSLAKVMDIVGENLRRDGLYEEYRELYLTQRLQLLHGMYDFIIPKLKSEASKMIDDRCAELDMDMFLRTKIHLLSKRSQLFYKMRRGSYWAEVQYNGLMAIRTIYRKIKK